MQYWEAGISRVQPNGGNSTGKQQRRKLVFQLCSLKQLHTITSSTHLSGPQISTNKLSWCFSSDFLFLAHDGNKRWVSLAVIFVSFLGGSCQLTFWWGQCHYKIYWSHFSLEKVRFWKAILKSVFQKPGKVQLPKKNGGKRLHFRRVHMYFKNETAYKFKLVYEMEIEAH